MDISFTYPLVLLALIVPLLLLAWVWRRAARRVALPFDHGGGRKGRRWWVLISFVESLAPLTLAVVIVILAGPQQFSEPKTKKRLTNIEFCVDVSGSMQASFGSGSRYDASMEAINEFIDYRDGDAFGLTIFGHNVLHWIPLTNDVSAFRCAPPFLRPENLPPWFNGTMIGKGLRACQDVLTSREDGDRMIILISDGFSSDLMNGQDERIAASLRDDGIVVYAVHVASGGIPGEVITITSRTGGEVFAPGDTEGLKSVFQRIDAMQETRLEKTNVESMDNFVPWSTTALGMLGVLVLGLFGLRYTPW